MISIAEIGINWFGDMSLAKKLIKKSKDAGATIAKFQYYRPIELLGESSPYIDDARRGIPTKKQIKELKQYCEDNGIEFGLSIFHDDDVAFAEEIGLKRYKIASRSANNDALLMAVNRTAKPVIMSTGLSSHKQIKHSLSLLNNCDVQLLYCVCKYPSAVSDFDFSKMTALKKFARPFGFSSHCPKAVPTIEAVSQGAQVIENHVVDDPVAPGCDVPSSMPIETYAMMLNFLREAKCN